MESWPLTFGSLTFGRTMRGGGGGFSLNPCSTAQPRFKPPWSTLKALSMELLRMQSRWLRLSSMWFSPRSRLLPVRSWSTTTTCWSGISQHVDPSHSDLSEKSLDNLLRALRWGEWERPGILEPWSSSPAQLWSPAWEICVVYATFCRTRQSSCASPVVNPHHVWLPRHRCRYLSN